MANEAELVEEDTDDELVSAVVFALVVVVAPLERLDEPAVEIAVALLEQVADWGRSVIPTVPQIWFAYLIVATRLLRSRVSFLRRAKYLFLK